MTADSEPSEKLLATPTETKFRNAIRSQSKLINFLLIAGVPTFLAIWISAIDQEKVGTALYWIILVVLIALQMFMYFASDRYIETMPELYMQAISNRESESLHLEEITEYNGFVDWLSAANRLGSYWSTYQALIAETEPATLDEFKDSCRVALGPMIEAADTLFDFAYDDIWSIAVYEFVEADNLLAPVWFKRTEDHPSTGDPRSWVPGDGHVGSAFMQNRILFTYDMADDSDSMLLKPSASNAKPYDEAIYRSFISAPITLDTEPDASRFGVLVMTSNKSGRFDSDNKSIVAQAAQVLCSLFDWKSRLLRDSE